MENFHVKILELVESGQLKEKDMANLNICHDGWCDRLNGVGPCNCDPEVRLYPARDINDFITTFLALRNSPREH